MYTKWEDIEEEVCEAAGISPGQILAYTKNITQGIKELRHFSFDMFMLGTLSFRTDYMRYRITKEDDPLQREFVDIFMKYYARYPYSIMPQILKKRCEEYSIPLPRRTKVWRGKLKLDEPRAPYTGLLGPAVKKSED